MLIGEAELIPLTVIEFDVSSVFSATPVCDVKLNASGTVSTAPASVVTENDPEASLARASLSDSRVTAAARVGSGARSPREPLWHVDLDFSTIRRWPQPGAVRIGPLLASCSF